MNIKLLVALGSTVFLAGQRLAMPVNFQYEYQVVCNSYSVEDEIEGYYYKERLIDTYEDLAFKVDERKHQEVIKNNIELFAFDEKCIPCYYQGKILLIVGEGLGPSVKGRLKKSECDNEVIREKYFILDLFA